MENKKCGCLNFPLCIFHYLTLWQIKENMFRIIPLLILLLSTVAFSQTVMVKRAGNGKARITVGKVRKIINLSKDLAGCIMAFDRSDPKIGRMDVSGFELIDSVIKRNANYIVLLGTTIGNCNIQGQCGATDTYTLYWLKLNKALVILDKQVAIIQDCLDDINMTEDTALRPYKGTLTVKYEDNLYQQSSDYTFSTLIYVHSEPEKGFIIKTEKRERPKN